MSKSVALIVGFLLQSCASGDLPCQVTPLGNSKPAIESAQKLNADLLKVQKQAAPSVGLENELKSTLDSTYQAVPEKHFACAMILHAINCCEHYQNPALANKLADYMIAKNICASGLKSMTTVDAARAQ